MKKFSKLLWECECGDLFISDPLEHHKMDSCSECGCAVDLETYSCRFIGNVKVIKNIIVPFNKLRLKPCWGTYGINGDEEYRKISVNEMSINHMDNIINKENPSEYIVWLINKEKKLRNLVKQELDLCLELQGFLNKWDLGDGLRDYLDLTIVLKLNEIEKEVYLSFLK